MESPLENLRQRLNTIRGAGASPDLLNNISVALSDCHATLGSVASIVKVSSLTVKITPYHRMYARPIEKAIHESNLGLNPQDNGQEIFIEFPPLTTERREELVKLVKQYGEDAKISIRQERKRKNDLVKWSEMSDDEKRIERIDIQQTTDHMVSLVDNMVSGKSDDIMKV
jgi:ribosome recycling factor